VSLARPLLLVVFIAVLIVIRGIICRAEGGSDLTNPPRTCHQLLQLLVNKNVLKEFVNFSRPLPDSQICKNSQNTPKLTLEAVGLCSYVQNCSRRLATIRPSSGDKTESKS
jgi:hypothetical protein